MPQYLTARSAKSCKQKFTDEFEPVGSLFYSVPNAAETLAYMSFRALAQTDEDFSSWVQKFQDHQNPNLQPSPYNPEQEYEEGTIITFTDENLGENAVREFRATQTIQKGQAPNLSKNAWEFAFPMIMKLVNNFFLASMCSVSCRTVRASGQGSQPDLYGLRTSLAAIG